MKFFEFATCGNFFLGSVSNDIFFVKTFFYPIFEVFAKHQEKFKVGKVNKYDEETEYIEQKRFHPPKRHV